MVANNDENNGSLANGSVDTKTEKTDNTNTSNTSNTIITNSNTIITNNTKYKIWCDARLEAAKFYERFGMQKEGEIFYKDVIPYSVYALYI